MLTLKIVDFSTRKVTIGTTPESLSKCKLPPFPPELWIRIFHHLHPVEQVGVMSTFYEFEDAVRSTLSDMQIEIFQYQNLAIEREIDIGFECNRLQHVARVSHILSVDGPTSRTLAVVHKPQYIDWSDHDITLNTHFLQLARVCWLKFNLLCRLSPALYNIFFKMRIRSNYFGSQIRTGRDVNVQGVFEITVTVGDARTAGYLNLADLRNLSVEYWTWVPVYSSLNETDLFELDVGLRTTDVQLDLFNNNPHWTYDLAWHGVTFSNGSIPVHTSNCTCGTLIRDDLEYPDTTQPKTQSTFLTELAKKYL